MSDTEALAAWLESQMCNACTHTSCYVAAFAAAALRALDTLDRAMTAASTLTMENKLAELKRAWDQVQEALALALAEPLRERMKGA